MLSPETDGQAWALVVFPAAANASSPGMLLAAVMPQAAVSAIPSFGGVRPNMGPTPAPNIARAQMTSQMAIAQQMMQRQQAQGGVAGLPGFNQAGPNRPFGGPTMTPEMIQALFRRSQEGGLNPP